MNRLRWRTAVLLVPTVALFACAAAPTRERSAVTPIAAPAKATPPPSFIPATAVNSVRYRDASFHVGDPIITYDAFMEAGRWHVQFRCVDSYRCVEGADERSTSYVLAPDNGSALDAALDVLAASPSQPFPGYINGRTTVVIRRGTRETVVRAYDQPLPAITRVRELLGSGYLPIK